MKALFGSYLISDQYGTSKDEFIGIFDDEDLLQKAKTAYEEKHSNTLCRTEITEIEINHARLL